MKCFNRTTISQWVLLLALLTVAPFALAQNALYVANGDDTSADNGASSVALLESDGWTVTAVYDDKDPTTGANATLETADLSGFDLIVFGASDDNKAESTLTTAATIAALEEFASNGGFVFVTGYDSIASPEDYPLASFLAGATVAEPLDESGTTATQLPSFLTEGVFDITGFDLTQFSFDMDAIKQADLNPNEAKCVTGPDAGDVYECSWTIRAVGQGCVAYVSIGDDSGQVEADPYFESVDPQAEFYPYAAALLNFAYHSLQATEEYACVEGIARQVAAPESIPATGQMGLILLSLMVVLGAVFGFRRMV